MFVKKTGQQYVNTVETLNYTLFILHIPFNIWLNLKNKCFFAGRHFVTITEDCRWEKKIKGDREIKKYCTVSSIHVCRGCRLRTDPIPLNNE